MFRLAQTVANIEVAVATTILTAIYPVFFAQSSLVHLDLAAAGFTFWGLRAYVRGRGWEAALWFSLASLTKETAILAPLALFAWDVLASLLPAQESKAELLPASEPESRAGFCFRFFLSPPGTSSITGGPVLFSAILNSFATTSQATIHPLRVVLALLVRLWQTLGYFHLLMLTLAALFAMWLPPLRDRDGERPRIALDVQFAMLSVIVAYVFAMALVGGAELARYMLPVVPLVILVCVSTLWRRVRLWRGVVAIVALMFVSGWFINPPYGFAPEDNLAYRDYIRLHQHAEEFLEARYPMARVLTAWPASDELTRPYLGYVTRPMRVVRIENFAAEQLHVGGRSSLRVTARADFEVALVFSTKYEPAHPLLEHWRLWQEWKTRFFDYHRDVPPAAAAQILGGNLVYTETRNGQWIGVIEMERIVDARN